jgi:hypothetical protein
LSGVALSLDPLMKRTFARAFVLVLVLGCHASLAAGQETVPGAAPPSAAAEPPAEAPPPEAPPSPPAPPASEPAPAPPPAEPPALAPFPSATAPGPEPTPPTASFESAAAPPAAAAAPAAPPAATPSAASAPHDDRPEKKKNDTDGVLGPFRIGPVVGIGLPSLINVGGVIKLTAYFAAGVDIGVAPSVNLPYYGDATVSYHSYEAYAHVHPFGGGLYLGAALGYALASGTAEETVSLDTAAGPVRGTLRSEGSVQTLVLTPELGYFYTFKSGFSLGVGAGLQIPVASSEIEYKQEVDSPYEGVIQEYLDPTRRAVEDSLEKVGQTPLPTVGVCIGWLL